MILRNCIEQRVDEQIVIERTVLMEKMRATVKSEGKDQIRLAIEIGRIFASVKGIVEHA